MSEEGSSDIEPNLSAPSAYRIEAITTAADSEPSPGRSSSRSVLPFAAAQNRSSPFAPSNALPPAAAQPSLPPVVSFDRLELREILNLYGRKVAAGEWRDYAIDCLKERAVFSVFRRTSEVPMYRIEKDPRLARRQGAYSVITASGLILKRGHDLARVISVLDRSSLRVVG
ncbi:conserved hypothetical protein [Hyphomicrobiales bacterium]|nr:conserved hypothetical protein [Hyphomicrobiales bacterium]CAH1684210.1 conserved hypothetical protein [Hyphomicrobiales bacterium]